MKKIIASVLLLAFCNIYTPALAAIKVPVGTEINISPEKRVTSADEQANISVVIDEDVIVNGIVVFKAGDKGVLYIADQEEASYFGKSGELLIVNGYLIDAKNNKQKISITKKIKAKEKTWVKVTCACGLILWPLLLVGFVKGKDAVIPASKTLTVTTTNDFTY